MSASMSVPRSSPEAAPRTHATCLPSGATDTVFSVQMVGSAGMVTTVVTWPARSDVIRTADVVVSRKNAVPAYVAGLTGGGVLLLGRGLGDPGDADGPDGVP